MMTVRRTRQAQSPRASEDRLAFRSTNRSTCGPYPMSKPFLVYGATGYTGKLLTLAARERKLSPILCGRNEEKLRSLASSFDLEFRTAALEDANQLDRAIKGVSVVLNAAGPFSATTSRLVDACIRRGVHYLDISGEVAAIEEAARRGPDAKARRLMIMPGVGFDVVPSDCIAAHVSRRSKKPARLFI